jgi:hypothetical protein
MRKIFILLFIICFSSIVYGQNKAAGTAEKKPEPKTETKTDIKPDTKTNGKNGDKTAKKDETKEPEKKGDTIEKIPDGYGNLTWGMYLSEAKPKISNINYTDEKKVIIANDGELQYYYGFFYKQPSAEKKEITPAENKESKTADKKDIKKVEPVPGKEIPAKDEKKETEQEKDEGRLFYVSINFPYLDKDKIYEKIQKKYGKHSKENIKENQGALAWDSDNTVIIMWIDQYNRKPYCKKIIYISKKISAELNEYTYSILNKTELEVYNKINLESKGSTNP